MSHQKRFMDRVHESRVLGPLKPIRPHHRHNYNGWYAYSYKFSCLSVYLSTYLPTYLPTLCGYLSIYLSSFMSSASYLLLGFWDINKTQKKRKHKRTKKVTAKAQCTSKRKKNLAQNVTPHKKPTNKRTKNVKKNVTSRKKTDTNAEKT